MPKVCKLCVHKRRSEIDKVIAHGTSFKEFRKRLRLRGVSVYQWSRHRAHLAQRLDSNASVAEWSASADHQELRKVNRRLLILADKAEKTGKTAQAVSAYGALSRNIELLSRLLV